MPSVLFVCTANQFRSPLAAACLKDLIQGKNDHDEWRVESAGTWANPGLPATPLAIQNADRLGLKGLESHRTRQVSRELLERFDLILAMESGHLEGIASEFPSIAGRLKLLSAVATGSAYNIPDPFDEGSDPQQVANELQELIQKGGEKILAKARALSKIPPKSERSGDAASAGRGTQPGSG